MYTPSSFAEQRGDVLFPFLEAHPFGALITSSALGIRATHLPFLVDRTRGDAGTIYAHMARANREHAGVSNGDEAMLMVTGPDAYISPSWYPSKQEHGKVVPTWDYVAVHVYGSLRFVDDAAWLRAHVGALTARREGAREHPWAVGDAPDAFIAQQLKAIVGVELSIARMEGKWKMSQNRSAADVASVAANLARSADARERAVGELVEEHAPERVE
ncbi:MAG: FMN-binding negative transcriptional regulator [Gemmatimonadaceae bacterium]